MKKPTSTAERRALDTLLRKALREERRRARENAAIILHMNLRSSKERRS